MITGNAGAGGADWRAARVQALDVLRDALEWELPKQRWQGVNEAISDMAVAVSAASVDALWQAIGSLDLFDTTRTVRRLGDTPPLPAPVAVRDRIADLIDTLAAESGPEGAEPPGRVIGAAVAETGEAGR